MSKAEAVKHPNLLALSSLFSKQLGLTKPASPLTADQFGEMVETVMEEAGVKRPGQARTADARVVRMFLLMARHSYQRMLNPAPEPDRGLVQKALSVRSKGPETKSNFAQSRCDEASACRRVAEIERRVPEGATVLFLGDDDGVSPLLAEKYQVTMIDLDDEIVQWIAEVAPEVRARRCHVLQTPDSFTGAFQAVVADPIRGMEAEWFLLAAQKCLAAGGHFFWADHPDWNFAFPVLQFQAEKSMELLDCLENWHCYPASTPVSAEETSGLGSEHQRFLELGRLISLWSNLYIFRKRVDCRRS